MLELLIIYLIGYIISTFIIINLLSRLMHLDPSNKKYNIKIDDDYIIFAYIFSCVWFIYIPILLIILAMAHIAKYFSKFIAALGSYINFREVYIRAANFRFLSKDQ